MSHLGCVVVSGKGRCRGKGGGGGGGSRRVVMGFNCDATIVDMQECHMT